MERTGVLEKGRNECVNDATLIYNCVTLSGIKALTFVP